jgi:Holliday junction resolvase RusA-like endonuclease
MLSKILEQTPDLILNLPQPPSVNTAYNNSSRGRVKNQLYKNWIAEADLYLITSGQQKLLNKIKPPYAVIYEISKYNKVKRDCANYEKLLSDYLVRINVLEEDSLIDLNIQMFVKRTHKISTAKIYSLWQRGKFPQQPE